MTERLFENENLVLWFRFLYWKFVIGQN